MHYSHYLNFGSDLGFHTHTEFEIGLFVEVDSGHHVPGGLLHVEDTGGVEMSLLIYPVAHHPRRSTLDRQ